MAIATYTTTPDTLTQEQIEEYRTQGFVHLPGVISPEEAERYRDAALALAQRMGSFNQDGVFTQLVNAWREDEAMGMLSFHPNVTGIARKLAGVPLRMWHDQTLIVSPGPASLAARQSTYLNFGVGRPGRRPSRARLHDVHPRLSGADRPCSLQPRTLGGLVRSCTRSRMGAARHGAAAGRGRYLSQ